MPSLKDVMGKEEERRKRVSDNSRSLGVSQAFELGERSSIEYVACHKRDAILNGDYRKTKIAELEREIAKMASQMQVSLGLPPLQGEREDDEGV